MDKTKKKTISLIGIPFDEKSSFLKGCAKAPPLIRESLNSYAINSFAENGMDIRNENIIDRGDFSVKELSEVVNIADDFLRKGDSILALGGDHSITYPLVK
ncbi:MAG: arginase family protein, partial [Candidatus Aminicenantes bacterium]|nr:arginase family protein [Candidatus Aminicenantes bacterium]